MATETLIEYPEVVIDRDGIAYRARALGCEREDGKWEGWVELQSIADGAIFPTPRETTQPNHTDLVYWATGLTHVFLEGALVRARGD